MLRRGQFFLLIFVCPIFACQAALAADDSWKSKHPADWTDAETKQILSDSPWAAMVTPVIKKPEKKAGWGHGIGLGRIGIGIPGRRRSDNGQNPDAGTGADPAAAGTLNIRWESALPIREAELKARETNAPVVDEDHYAIAVYGIPTEFAKRDPKGMAEHLKGEAALKREGQKDLKPSHVDVIEREDDLLVVFLFPRTKEITAKDSTIDFEVQIGTYQITQSFHVGDMVYLGKMEL